MSLNPYSVPSPVSDDSSGVQKKSADLVSFEAFLAAIGVFGVAYLVLAALVPFVVHGEWQAFPIGDSAYFMYLIIAALSAGIVFASVLTRTMTKARWVPPLACVLLQIGTAILLYRFGGPAASQGVFDLTALFALCVLGLTPCVVCFSMVRLAGKAASMIAIPYVLLGWMFAHQWLFPTS